MTTSAQSTTGRGAVEEGGNCRRDISVGSLRRLRSLREPLSSNVEHESDRDTVISQGYQEEIEVYTEVDGASDPEVDSFTHLPSSGRGDSTLAGGYVLTSALEVVVVVNSKS